MAYIRLINVANYGLSSHPRFDKCDLDFFLTFSCSPVDGYLNAIDNVVKDNNDQAFVAPLVPHSARIQSSKTTQNSERV